jgi:hypothetical protein
MIKKLINPFAYYSERTLFITGLISVAINLLMCYVLDLKMIALMLYGYDTKGWSDIVFTTLRTYIIYIIVYFILTWLINRRTRLIDIANTVFLTILPAFIILPLAEIPFIENANSLKHNKGDELSFLNILTFSVYDLIEIGIQVVFFVLLYNGIKTAANLKKTYQVIIIFSIFILMSRLLPYILK